MKYLVLGASSAIATEIIFQVSKDNDFLLITRFPELLKKTEEKLFFHGAKSVIVFQHDLSKDVSPMLDFIRDKRIDSIINCSSLSSGKRDNQINPEDIVDVLNADVLNSIRIIAEVIKISPNSKISIVFISSFLTELKSYNRNLYTSSKILMELFLNKICLNSNNVFVIVIKISQLIPKNTNGVTKIANKIVINLNRTQNFKEIWVGFSGRLLYSIFRLSPIFYDVVNFIQRYLRR
jgi:short-subunit dehydrogenase